jgi:hypothetical protein
MIELLALAGYPFLALQTLLARSVQTLLMLYGAVILGTGQSTDLSNDNRVFDRIFEYL